MSKNKTFNYRQRSVSAKAKFQRNQSPSYQKSGIKRNIRINTQGNDSQQRNHISRKRFYTSHLQTSNKSTQKVTKQPQQLVLQNFHLKVQLKDLNNKLYLTKSKIQSQKKKHITYSKKLNRQFEKQLYWPEQQQKDYLITGIKYQYQRLKQKYQEKCIELQQVKRTIGNTDIAELTSYCEVLQTENKALLENIYHLKKNKKLAPSYFRDMKQRQEEYQYLYLQQKRKCQKYRQKISDLQQRITQQNTKQKQLQKRIDFLQKVIIQKQNNAYHSNKKAKLVEKQKNKVNNLLKEMEKKILQNQKNFNVNIQNIKAQNHKQNQMQKSLFERNIRQKNIVIQKLQKQIGYLTTLLSYWKPLDQNSKFDKADDLSSQKQRSISVKNNSNYNNQKELINRSKTPIHSMLIDEQNYEEITKNIGKTLNHDEFFNNKDLSLDTINNQDDQYLPDGNNSKNREPRRASKKWCQNSKKCRKVNLSEIQHLGQFIKYKLISNRITIQGLKQYFSYKLSSGAGSNVLGNSNSISMSNVTHRNIEQQFISMKQIRQILISKPFQLSQQESFLLSRYIIQDSQGLEYVYCHQGNQLQRAIAKSIIKTLVGEYLLPQIQKCEQRWKQIKKQYSHNMQLALKSICPKGFISKDKFLELINSLGIETDQEMRNYLVGRLVEGQRTLDQLKYDILFTSQEKIQ